MTTNSHRPEGRSALVSYKAAQKRRSTSLASGVEPRKELDRVTRLFEHPLALSIPIAVGSQFLLGKAFYTIKKLRLAERLAGVEWWTPHAVHRDYLWAWLESERGATEALLYVDHSTGERFLQGLAD